jgi:Mn2+/Fe2+ NRAMP family transporter
VAGGVGLALLAVGILLVAAIATIACTLAGYQAALGHGGPIWKQVAAALGAYAGFTVVILSGLSRHWLAQVATREAALERLRRALASLAG